MKYKFLILFALSLFLTSCMTSKGLYPENAHRNKDAKRYMEHERFWYFVQ